MAGDWIVVRENLCNVREVLAIARMTGMNKYEVAGRLVAFWDWAQRETADGCLVDVDVDALVDAHVVTRELFAALVHVDWLRPVHHSNGDKPPGWPPHGHDGVFIPKFETWLSGGAKARLQKNKRQSSWRGKPKAVDASVDARVDAAASTEASTTVPYRTVPERDQNTHTRARDKDQNKGQGEGQEPENEDEFQPLSEDIERDNRFINCGQRPLKRYPSIWLTPAELTRVLEVADQAGLVDKRLLFEFVEGKLKLRPGLSGTVNAFNWLTGFALQECLETKKKSLDVKRSALYLAKASEGKS